MQALFFLLVGCASSSNAPKDYGTTIYHPYVTYTGNDANLFMSNEFCYDKQNDYFVFPKKQETPLTGNADSLYVIVPRDSITLCKDGAPVKVESNITQKMISFPILLAAKLVQSSFLVEIGGQISIPISDYLGQEDLIDKNLRTNVEKSILFGVEAIVNENIALQFLWDVQINSAYSNTLSRYLQNISYVGVTLGVTYYFL